MTTFKRESLTDDAGVEVCFLITCDGFKRMSIDRSCIIITASSTAGPGSGSWSYSHYSAAWKLWLW